MQQKHDDVIEIAVPVTTEVENNQTQTIEFTPEELIKIKQDIEAAMLTSIEEKSYLTRMANTWGEIPWWIKGLFLIIFFVPIALIVTLTPILWAIVTTASISIFCTLLYLSFSLLLDNHYHQENNLKASLLQKVNAVIDFFGNLMDNLKEIVLGFSVQVERLKTENDALHQHVNQFSDETEKLSWQNTAFRKEVHNLTDIDATLKEKVATLEALATQQKQQLQQQEEQMLTSKNLYTQKLEDAESQILTMKETHTSLEKELIRTKDLARSLSGFNASMKETQSKHQVEKEKFVQKNQERLKNKDQTFDTLLTELKSNAADLDITKNRFQSIIEEHQALLEVEKEQTRQIKTVLQNRAPADNPGVRYNLFAKKMDRADGANPDNNLSPNQDN